MNRRIPFLCTLFLILIGTVHAEPQVIIDTDFGVPGRSSQEITATKGIHITGNLVEGWGDNSDWKSNMVVQYKPIREGGRRFLRVEQTSGDGMQFMHGLPGIEKSRGYYRLAFKAGSRTGISLDVRDLGPPYSSLSSFTPATDGQWRDFSYDFRLSPHPRQIGLFSYMAGNGILDLQNLRLIKLSEQDLIGEIKAKYPQAGTGNLVNATKVPAGFTKRLVDRSGLLRW
jgi:hypothetical protein